MPDWSDPREIAKDGKIFGKLCLALLGMFTWEIVVQLPFDWSIISRKREAHWPSLFFFWSKYSLWLAIIGSVIEDNATTEIHCHALADFCHFMVGTSVASASTLLMIRTIAVWNRSPFIMIPLVVASLGQWVVLLHSIIYMRSSWSDAHKTCVVVAASHVFLGVDFLYTMSFDFIVLVLTTTGLVMSPGRSSLWQLLFRQGIIYFLVAFIANMVPAIFLLLNLNPTMNLMFILPAGCASSIVACRAFISLTSFQSKAVLIPRPTPYLSARAGSGGTPGDKDIVRARAGGAIDNSSTEKPKSMGNTVVGIIFRSVNEGIDSMSEAHTIGTSDRIIMTDMPGAMDPKRGYDLESASENGQVAVHVGFGKGVVVER